MFAVWRIKGKAIRWKFSAHNETEMPAFVIKLHLACMLLLSFPKLCDYCFQNRFFFQCAEILREREKWRTMDENMGLSSSVAIRNARLIKNSLLLIRSNFYSFQMWEKIKDFRNSSINWLKFLYKKSWSLRKKKHMKSSSLFLQNHKRMSMKFFPLSLPLLSIRSSECTKERGK